MIQGKSFPRSKTFEGYEPNFVKSVYYRMFSEGFSSLISIKLPNQLGVDNPWPSST